MMIGKDAMDGVNQDEHAPVIIGVGESSGRRHKNDWPSPTDLAAAAIHDALEDSGLSSAQLSNIDTILATRLFHHSGIPHEFGAPDNVPAAIADKITKTIPTFKPRQYIYGDNGGQSPQRHIHDLAPMLADGSIRAAILCGAEAGETVKRARKTGHKLDWAMADNRPFEDWLTPYPILTPYEIRHGIISMPIAYSLLENARRAAQNMDHASYRMEMAALWSELSETSLDREHAHFAGKRTPSSLITAEKDNFDITDAYLRWMVAQDKVDLGGAIILTTWGQARKWGIGSDNILFLWTGADADMPLLSRRHDLAQTPAIDHVIRTALTTAGISADELGPIDLYSCFPYPVSTGREALVKAGLDTRAGHALTLTGGLSFFGGPGNNYSLHALVAMAQSLRTAPEKPALILANGGVASKQSAGIYGKTPPPHGWKASHITPKKLFPSAHKEDIYASGIGHIISYTIPVTPNGPAKTILWVEHEDGRRLLAQMVKPIGSTSKAEETQDLLDRRVMLTTDGTRNQASLI